MSIVGSPPSSGDELGPCLPAPLGFGVGRCANTLSERNAVDKNSARKRKRFVTRKNMATPLIAGATSSYHTPRFFSGLGHGKNHSQGLPIHLLPSSGCFSFPPVPPGSFHTAPSHPEQILLFGF